MCAIVLGNLSGVHSCSHYNNMIYIFISKAASERKFFSVLCYAIGNSGNATSYPVDQVGRTSGHPGMDPVFMHKETRDGRLFFEQTMRVCYCAATSIVFTLKSNCKI
jgi:hypothetical protein